MKVGDLVTQKNYALQLGIVLETDIPTMGENPKVRVLWQDTGKITDGVEWRLKVVNESR